MRNISAWAIRNPVIPLVLFTFLLEIASLLTGAICDAATGEDCLVLLRFG